MGNLILEDHALIQQYQVNTTWSDADQAYIAEMPELPGCISDGATEAESRRNIQMIAQEWLDTARLLGRSIPEPARAEAYA